MVCVVTKLNLSLGDFSLRERHEPFGKERVKGSEGSKQAHFFMEIVYRGSDKNPPP